MLKSGVKMKKIKPHPQAEIVKQWADNTSLKVWIWHPGMKIWRQVDNYVLNFHPKFVFAVGRKPRKHPIDASIIAT